jgi:hypothetical protein
MQPPRLRSSCVSERPSNRCRTSRPTSTACPLITGHVMWDALGDFGVVRSDSPLVAVTSESHQHRSGPAPPDLNGGRYCPKKEQVTIRTPNGKKLHPRTQRAANPLAAGAATRDRRRPAVEGAYPIRCSSTCMLPAEMPQRSQKGLATVRPHRVSVRNQTHRCSAAACRRSLLHVLCAHVPRTAERWHVRFTTSPRREELPHSK